MIQLNYDRTDLGYSGRGPREDQRITGSDAAELVNLQGDEATVCKLDDGTYMDCVDMRYIYNGADDWFDEAGVEWNDNTIIPFPMP